MQLATTTTIPTTPVPSTRSIAPGATIGTAQLALTKDSSFGAEVHAGAVLATGVRDIRTAAQELMQRSVEEGSGVASGLVGFVRNGDAWDAVELLAPSKPGMPEHQIWAPWTVRGLKVAPGVQLDAIWQISGFGGDSHWREAGSMIPEVR